MKSSTSIGKFLRAAAIASLVSASGIAAHAAPVTAGLPAPASAGIKHSWSGTLSASNGMLLKDGQPFFPIGFVSTLGDQDLSLAAAMGCNSVHCDIGWAQTSPNGKLSAGTLNTFRSQLQNAGSWGLACFPFLVGHYVPDWFKSEHPITEGQPIGSDGQRTGERFPYSIHYQPFKDALAKFWTSAAPGIASEPNVMTINIWGEPSYGGTFAHPNQFADYSQEGIADYRVYLRTKYKDIGALQSAHGQQYGSFDSVQPPHTPDELGRAAWLDWMEYGQKAVAGFFNYERGVMKEVAPNALLANENTTTVWDASAASSGINWYLDSASQDVAGIDLYGSAPRQRRDIVAAARSESGGKPTVLYETNTQGVGAAGKTPQMVRNQLWSAVIGGASGMFIYTLYGNDAIYGLTSPTAYNTPTRAQFPSIIHDIAQYQAPLAAKPVRARIAVLYSTTAVLQNPGNKVIPGRFLSAYDLCRNSDYEVDFLPQERVTAAGLEPYKVLVVPTGSILKPAELSAVANWTNRGGKVLAFQGSLATDENMKPTGLPSWMPGPSGSAFSSNSRGILVNAASDYSDQFRPAVQNALEQGAHISPEVRVTDGSGAIDPNVLISIRQGYEDSSKLYLLALNTVGPTDVTIHLPSGWRITREDLHGAATSGSIHMDNVEMYIFEISK